MSYVRRGLAAAGVFIAGIVVGLYLAPWIDEDMNREYL